MMWDHFIHVLKLRPNIIIAISIEHEYKLIIFNYTKIDQTKHTYICALLKYTEFMTNALRVDPITHYASFHVL